LDRFVVITGCSGGGKSTLLAELGRRGHAVVPEPGRRIVEQELAGGGANLPWSNPEGFARRAVEMARADLDGARGEGLVFFDRGLVDAGAALAHATGRPLPDRPGTSRSYDRTVFVAPPWPEIYGHDAARRHDLSEALEEYERLCAVYPDLGYDLVHLPRTGVGERADFVLAQLA